MRYATLFLFAAALLALPAQAQVINEIMVSTTGIDTEFVEIGGASGTDLSGLTILVIEGDASSSTGVGTLDNAIDLTGSIPADGYWVMASPEAESAFGITPDQQIPDNSFENGTETILLVTGFSGTIGDDLDTDDDGTLDSMPWTSIVDEIALVDGGINDASDPDQAYSATTFGPDGDFLPAGAYLTPNMTGSYMLLEFDPKPAPTATPGTANPDSTPAEDQPVGFGRAFVIEAAPNPFVSSSDITVVANQTGSLTVEAFDLLGRRVATLFSGEAVVGTPVEATFERDALPAGVYLIRVTGETASETIRVTIAR